MNTETAVKKGTQWSGYSNSNKKKPHNGVNTATAIKIGHIIEMIQQQQS